jgi:hypothetical protein
MKLRMDSREHLSWAAGIAKKYILKDNDWRLSIRNQGVMTEVWLSAVTLLHEDDTESVTVPVTSEGSSRVIACHDILDIRSADVPYLRDDRSLRSIVRTLNAAIANGPSVEQAEALRCETIPALLLVGFEPHDGSAANFATAVRSLVALRHVDYPKPWNEAAKMESIADAVLEALAEEGLITENDEKWLAGGLTAEEAVQAGFSADPAVRAARIVRLLTDSNPTVHHTIRVAITGQTTKQRITNKFKLQVAAALIMRSVTAGDEREKVTDIYRAFQDGFSDTLATAAWQATYRPTEQLVASALREIEDGGEGGADSLELAARSAYPLIVARQLFSDRGTSNNDQPDRRHPGQVIERMRITPRGIHQLGQALRDESEEVRARAVADDGSIIHREDGAGDQIVTDGWLRRTFPPPGRPAAPPVPETAHERLMEALSLFGDSIDALSQATRRLAAVDGIDGRPLIESEGVDPHDADVWSAEMIRIAQQMPVWKSIHVARHGVTLTEPAWNEDQDSEDMEEWEEVPKR